MRKVLIVLTIAVAAAVGPALADIPDGVDCAQSGLGYIPVQLTNGDLDRIALCVTDGVSKNGAEAYIGGEFDPENATQGACTAIIVAGRSISGDPNWNHVDLGANPLNTDDDVLHDCN